MKIFAGLPCYDGKVDVDTARSLLNEQVAAQAMDCELRVAFLPGSSLITHARNQLAQDFLDSDADRLVFVDADVSWDLGSLLRLAHHPKDVVGGAYRFKTEPESYPVSWLDRPELWADPETGLLDVAAVPGGFLAISRDVFAKLREAFPDRAYSHGGHDFHGYFHAPIIGGQMYGEDSAFCTDWRSIGGQVWLDPTLRLTHSGGVNTYTGVIGDWLKGRGD